MAPGGGGKALLARASLFGEQYFVGRGGGKAPLAPLDPRMRTNVKTSLLLFFAKGKYIAYYTRRVIIYFIYIYLYYYIIYFYYYFLI